MSERLGKLQKDILCIAQGFNWCIPSGDFVALMFDVHRDSATRALRTLATAGYIHPVNSCGSRYPKGNSKPYRDSCKHWRKQIKIREKSLESAHEELAKYDKGVDVIFAERKEKLEEAIPLLRQYGLLVRAREDERKLKNPEKIKLEITNEIEAARMNVGKAEAQIVEAKNNFDAATELWKKVVPKLNSHWATYTAQEKKNLKNKPREIAHKATW